MRKLILALLALIAALALASCSDAAASDAELKIVTTIFPQYDFARQIAEGEDGVSLQMLLPPGSESHDFEPSVADLAAVAEADLIICVGGETDSWIDAAISASGSSASVLRLTDMVPLYEEDSDNILESGHSHAHEDEADGKDEYHDRSGYDEHVWTSPAAAAQITEEICREMVRLAPDKREVFEANAKSYCEELLELDRLMSETASAASERVLIFADRFPFRYLAEHLGLDCYAAFSGCSSDSEPSLATIWQLTKTAKELDVPVILTVEFSSGDAAEIIAKETGATVRTLHSCHNVSKEDFESGVTYLSLMRRNLEVLKEALG